MRALALSLLLLCQLTLAQEPVKDARRSGYAFMLPSTQAMQNDESQNPGMLWLKDGEALWNRKTGAADKACASCHQASSNMRGVAARYPAFDPALKLPVNLARRINLCRERHQKAAPLALESADLLSLETLVAFQSRGLPQMSPADPQLDAVKKRGEQRFNQRIGQLNLSCAQCHDANAGRRLASSVIPQAHATGYPVYRLEWQGQGSLQRRLRNCMAGVRADVPAYGAQELVELEVFLASRAQGMLMEAPAVRP